MSQSGMEYFDRLKERVSELEAALEACEQDRDECKKNQQRYQLLVEECPSGVVIHSDEQIVYANKAAATIAGAKSSDQLLGEPIWDFVSDDHREHVREKLLHFGDDDRCSFAIQQLQRFDGRIIHAEVLAVAVTFEGKQAILALISDITERKRAEEEQKQQQGALAQAQRLASIGEISAELMHEINNPLTAIILFTQSGLAAVHATDDQTDLIRECLEHIDEQSKRAHEIMARMRSFSRSSTPHLARDSLNKIIRALIPLLEIEAKRFQAFIDYQLSDPLPDVLVERLLIEQVLINLVRNGVEAMAAAPLAERRLAIGTRRNGDEVEVSVEDSGVGLAEHDFERVFDRFFTKKIDGVGLGLAICRTIVESHGGRIWVTRNEERGVTFYFTIPTSGENP